eukprot:s13340_g1.t1
MDAGGVKLAKVE